MRCRAVATVDMATGPSQYSKPTAPGTRKKSGRKSKLLAKNVLRGADDHIDEFHKIKVIDITEFQQQNTKNNQLDALHSSNIIPLFDDDPLELDFDKSVAIDTDSDWESDDGYYGDVNANNSKEFENNDQKTSLSTHHSNTSASVEHFRIKSVTIFTDKLIEEMDEKKKEKSDNSWLAKRKLLESELIETEKHYCADLNTLCNEILTKIFDKKLLDEKYKAQITSNLPQITAFHNDYFLKQLINGDIIQVFNKSSDFLKMYISFVKEYQTILDIFAIHGNKSKNKKLYKFLKQKRKEKKPLTNLLIAPIQRIPRYLLLLQDIKKKTPCDYKDYQDINCALNKVNDITNHINERQREIENMSQCLQIQNKLRCFKQNLVEPHRKYINQFTFNVKSGKIQKKLKLNQFCVFSDTVIVTDAKWKVIKNMKMRSINMSKINDAIGKGFELRYLEEIAMYYDTQETMHDDVQQFIDIIDTEKQLLLKNDLSLFNAGSSSMKHELKRIANEAVEEKKCMLVKLRNYNSDPHGRRQRYMEESIVRAHTLPIEGKKAEKKNIWGRSLKMEKDYMCVEWKFIDGNDAAHCVVLQHQQIKGSPNKKTMRKIEVDNIEKFSSTKSNKTKFKFALNSEKGNGKKGVTLIICIKYDSKKCRYSYPMLINGKSYPEAFKEWQTANKR